MIFENSLYVDGVIVLANTGSSERLKITHDEIIGEQINSWILSEFIKPLKLSLLELWQM